jgi:DHA2 family multidrug resistance protein
MSGSVDTANRWPITISIMLTTVMNSIDITIANVALPHVQGSLGAGPEQIGWVLTSYIIAAAIATPLTGWMAARVGRKRLLLISICGFTAASMACGLATSLPELVAFRLLQGVCGACTVPIGQAILLDVTPPEEHGKAMALWGTGAILGPILGPGLGGLLTEQLSWRWCFFINLPIGIATVLGLWLFVPSDVKAAVRRFDFLGFGMLTLFVGGFQLVLDRGPGQDWYNSTEIWIETIVALIGLWVFVAHTVTSEHPFFDRRLVRDANFVASSVFGFFVGILMFSTLALAPAMTQVLLGYPVLTAGMVTMPRGIGSLFAMLAVGRLMGRVDARLLMFVGLAISGLALWEMTRFDLSMTAMPIMTSGFVQGLGLSLIFVPISTQAFATLAPELRAEGSAVYNLVRSLGGSVGISMMQALTVFNGQTMHDSLAARVIPTDPVVRDGLPAAMNPATEAGLSALNTEITRQAMMVAYVDDFRLLFIITLASMPLLLLLRDTRRRKGDAAHATSE